MVDISQETIDEVANLEPLDEWTARMDGKRRAAKVRASVRGRRFFVQGMENWLVNAIEDARDLLARVDVEEVARLEGMIEGYSNALHWVRTGQS